MKQQQQQNISLNKTRQCPTYALEEAEGTRTVRVKVNALKYEKNTKQGNKVKHPFNIFVYRYHITMMTQPDHLQPRA